MFEFLYKSTTFYRSLLYMKNSGDLQRDNENLNFISVLPDIKKTIVNTLCWTDKT